MRLIILLVACSITSQFAFSQDKVVYFSDAIKGNIKKYNTKSDVAFGEGDIERGNALFDSLVQNSLVGSRFDDYSFKSVNSQKIKLSKIKKPVFIITYASWCLISKGEIPALNKLARKYKKQLEVIVVFWDVKNDMRKISREFNHNVKVCYANESYQNDEAVVATLKHTLGFPTSYYLDSNLNVVDIKRGGIQLPAYVDSKQAFELNYSVFDERIAELLTRKTAVDPQLAITDQ